MPKKKDKKTKEDNCTEKDKKSEEDSCTEEPIAELGPGWKRVGRERASGTTVYTFLSPEGRVFKTKKDAKKFLVCSS